MSIIQEGFTLVNSDTLFPTECFERLRDHDGSALVVNTAKTLDEEEMKIRVEDGRVATIGKDLKRADGEYIGVCKFEPEDAVVLVRHLDDLIEAGRTNEWYEEAFDRLISNRPPNVVKVRKDWIKIDDQDDLRAARQFQDIT